MRKLALLLVVPLIACGDDKGSDPNEPDFYQKLFDETVTEALTAYEEVGSDNWEARDVDLASCAPDPAPDGSFCTFEGQIIDFEEDEFLVELGGATVKVYPANRIESLDVSCDAPAIAGSCPATPPTCYQASAGSDGTISFPCIPCNTRFAVWAYKESSITPITKRAIEFDRWVEAGQGVKDINTISVATYGLIPGVVGFQPDPTMGLVAGRLRDCAENTIRYSHVNIERGTLTEPSNPEFAGDDPIYGVGTFYFVNEFPQKQQATTSQDGLWGIINVPSDQVTVFATGRRTAGGAVEQNVGRATLASFPDTITLTSMYLDVP